ncbi:MAG: DUF2911 domain-containing protein [Bacteroidota bacterium]
MKVFKYSLMLLCVLIAASCQPAADGNASEETATEEGSEEPANAPQERLSPFVEEMAKIGEVNVAITYSSPAVKGRVIWGELEEYGSVWRTGANEATTIAFDKDVMINGEALPAGKYSLFSIPREEGNWTIIFNSEWDQWGAYEYDETKDVLRVEVAAEMKEQPTERLNFTVEGEEVVFNWEKVSWAFNIASA